MKLNAEQLDRLLGDCKTPEDVDRLYSQLLQRVINRSLEAEMEVHLEDVKGTGSANRRNGKLPKVVKGAFGHAADDA
jgi:transposase-like protein